MYKIICILACMSLELFGFSQSASFECKYKLDEGSEFETIYCCDVQNSVNITSLDAAQVDSVSGTHLDGYNNDNVEIFNGKGEIHYFPRGLNKIFKNLKIVEISTTGLKEVHQSDLQVFPNLTELYLDSNNLEILEKNLFEFNPNLELIDLGDNKISHIDSNVFGKLSKLKSLNLVFNTCIDMSAYYNSTEVLEVIKVAKFQCISSDYSNFEQKVRNLEIESEKLKDKLESLENEVKNSKLSNFFQNRLVSLKSAQTQKEAQDETTTTTRTTSKPTTIAELPKTTTVATKTTESIKLETFSVLETKVDDTAADLTSSINIDQDLTVNSQCEAFKDDLRNQVEVIERIDNRTEAMDMKMEILEEKMENFLMEILQIKAAIKDANQGIIELLKFKADKSEKKMEQKNKKQEKNHGSSKYWWMRKEAGLA